MSWFDLCALLLVALAVFDGAKNGLAWTALEGLLVAAAAVAARLGGPRLEPYVLKVADLEPDDLRATAHLAVFAALALVAAGVLILLHPASKRWRFRHDRWLGAAVGAGTGLLAAVVVFSIVIWARPRPAVEESIAESRLLAVMRSAAANGLGATLPSHAAGRLAQLERP